MQKSLDRKLAAIHADPSGCREFILADAKDADMAFGIGAPGRSPEAHAGETRFRSLAEYRELMRQLVRQGLVGEVEVHRQERDQERSDRRRPGDGPFRVGGARRRRHEAGDRGHQHLGSGASRDVHRSPGQDQHPGRD